jgi:hypothetical protein
MAFVRGENRKAAGGCRGGNGDVLEAGIVGASAIENGAGVAGFLDAEGQDAPGIEMLDSGEPAAQALRLGGGADPLGAGDPAALPLEISAFKRVRSSSLSLTTCFLFATIPAPCRVEPDQARISVRGRTQRITLGGASH